MQKGSFIGTYCAIYLRVYSAANTFALGCFITCVFRTMNAVQAHYLVQSLHLTTSDLAWLGSIYFLGFALSQIPLGILFDRFGPRIVQSLFFILAAIGCLIFAVSHGVAGLIFARLLIGIGVAGGLTAALKANTVWFPKHLSIMNSMILGFGTLGALVAATPMQLFLAHFGWRNLNITLSIATTVIAILIFILVPNDMNASQTESLKAQIKGFNRVYTDRYFWRVTPLYAVTFGSFVAIQGLWVGPWLHHVSGMTVRQGANCISLLAIFSIFGLLSYGVIANFAEKRNIHSHKTLIGLLLISFIIQLSIIFQWDYSPNLSWALYGLFGQASILCYALIAKAFPKEYAGRALTGMTVVLSLFVFVAQYGFGWIVHSTGSYRQAFVLMVVLQILSLVWFLVPRKLQIEEEGIK